MTALKPALIALATATLLTACGGGPTQPTAPFDFTLSTDASVTLTPGTGADLNVTLDCHGNDESAAIAFADLPVGVTTSTPGVPCGTTTVALSAGPQVSPGDFTPTLTATTSHVSHTASFNLRVRHTPGSMDATFGSDGVVTLAPPFGFSLATAVVVQSDGKVVVVGSSDSAGHGADFLLARYTTSGALDPSFGQGGLVTTDFAGQDDRGQAVALQEDGKLVVAGRTVTALTSDGQPDIDTAVARYTPDGTLDPTFGTGGKTVTPMSPLRDEAHAVAVRADGKIMVAGSRTSGAASSANDDFALERLNPDGRLDTSFGQGGQVTTDFEGLSDVANALVLVGDQAVLGGFAQVPNQNGDRYRFALARYDEDGAPDASFGAGGSVTTVVGVGQSSVQAMLAQPDGKIVVAGGAVWPSQANPALTSAGFALARYTLDGTLDPAFNGGQPALTDVRRRGGTAYGVVRQPDGKIVAAGTGADVIALTRFGPDGTLDAPYGEAGTVLVPNRQDTLDTVAGVALDGDGKAVVVANRYEGGSSHVVLERFWP